MSDDKSTERARTVSCCTARFAAKVSTRCASSLLDHLSLSATNVELCNDIIREEMQDNVGHTSDKLPIPQDINATLDQYVIGQMRAKESPSRLLSTTHYKRLEAKSKKDDVEIAKSNIPLIGPTGSGKTLLAEPWRGCSMCRLPSPMPRSPRPVTSARMWKTSFKSCCRNATTMSKGADRDRLYRRDRQDLAQIRQPVDHSRCIG